MPYNEFIQFTENILPLNVAQFLNQKSANFNDVHNYYSETTGYFNESTVQSVMFMAMNVWINQNEIENHWLIRTEVQYPGFENIADIWATYDPGMGAASIRNIAFELKADFRADHVNEDIDVLDAVAGVVNPPINRGYACYVAQVGNDQWTQLIDQPTQPQTVATNQISVIF
ncbi:MAG: hypothetical protein AAF570_14690 [Bacteroidota bacterium]